MFLQTAEVLLLLVAERSWRLMVLAVQGGLLLLAQLLPQEVLPHQIRLLLVLREVLPLLRHKQLEMTAVI